MGLSLGAVARGVKQGFKDFGEAQRNIEEDDRKKKMFERDEKRFKWEERDAKRKEDDDAAAAELQAALLEGANPATYQNATAAGIQAPAQQTAGIQVPTAQAPAQPASPMGLQTAPGAAPVAGAPEQEGAAQQPASNPFMLGYEKAANPKQAYDQYMQRQEEALARYYTKTRQFDKLQELPEKMQKQREGKYAEKTKAALAGMASGEASAPLALQKVYSWVNDGYSLDVSKAKYDQKTGTWSGMVKVDDKTGDRSEFSMTGRQILSMAAGITPAAMLKYEDDRRDKAHEQANDDRKTQAAETTARASMLRAQNMNSDDDIVRNARVDSSLAQSLNRSLTTSMRFSKEPSDAVKQKAAMEEPEAMAAVRAYEADLKSLASAQRLGESILSLRRTTNKGITVAEASTVARQIVDDARRGKQIEPQTDDQGSYYMLGKKKIYINF